LLACRILRFKSVCRAALALSEKISRCLPVGQKSQDSYRNSCLPSGKFEGKLRKGIIAAKYTQKKDRFLYEL
jgi:hypothetical protein